MREGKVPVPGFSTLIDLLDRCRDVHPGRGVRLVTPQFRETYYPWSEIFARIQFHAAHLREQDIEQGRKVVVPFATDIDVICSFLALIWIGAVPVSVSGQLAGQDRGAWLRQITSLMEKSGFDRLLVDRSLASTLSDNLVIDPRGMVDPHPRGFDPDRTPPRVAPGNVAETDLALIQFSSGSTGDPRGVQITHRNICTNLKMIVENDGRSERSSGTTWLPLYHDMGLVGGFLSPMVHRHGFVLMHPVCFLMKPVTWLDYMSRYRGTTSVVPNFALEMCNTRIRDRHLEARQPDLAAMEYVYVGSEPVRAQTIETFYERFAPYGVRRGVFHPVYGMAETTLMITAPARGEEIATREVDGVRVVSVGRPVGDFRVRVNDREGRELPPGRVGELLVKGSSLTPGYFRDEAENDRRFRDGWFRTNDLGLIDEENRLFITGRLKDLIIVDGKNYYAHDIAAKIETLPFVRRGRTHVFTYSVKGREELIVMTVLDSSMTSAVRGKLDELERFLKSAAGSWLLDRMGAEMDEFIRDFSPQDVDLLKKAVKQYLMREFGLPIHDVFLVPRIPRTSSGKVKRDECEALYREHVEAASKPAT